MKDKLPVALTIAGSDSSGGAGIQADIKTFQRLGVFGTSAITCLTAQNPNVVRGIAAVRAEMVALQIMTVCEAFRVSAAKTGMLYSAGIIKAVADALEVVKSPFLVVDPVMVATSGARLLQSNAVKTLCARILPMASVITPNVPEAEILFGKQIRNVADLQAAARGIGERFGTACVVKGGHLQGIQAVDALFDPSGKGKSRMHLYSTCKVKVKSGTHGTGCRFSAALVAFLAHGEILSESVRKAKRFVSTHLLSS